MSKLTLLALAAAVAMGACTTTTGPAIGPDGRPLPKVYRIPANAGKVQFRMLDSINALRSASGASPLALNAQLNAAAATHSLDMSHQNRPWHFGSNGSSPLDRVAAAGYQGILAGENISETYETELETLAAWMSDPATRDVIIAPEATEMGFAWHQESNGKIWWTLVTGKPGVAQVSEIPSVDLSGEQPEVQG